MYSLCSEHYDKIEGEGTVDIQSKHEAEFESWFQYHICGHIVETVSKQIYDLACRPDHQVAMFKGCIVNGIRFHIIDYEQTLRTQNSGIIVPGEHHMTNIDFYGELKNIQVLRYITVEIVCIYLSVIGGTLGIEQERKQMSTL